MFSTNNDYIYIVLQRRMKDYFSFRKIQYICTSAGKSFVKEQPTMPCIYSLYILHCTEKAVHGRGKENINLSEREEGEERYTPLPSLPPPPSLHSMGIRHGSGGEAALGAPAQSSAHSGALRPANFCLSRAVAAFAAVGVPLTRA